MESKEQVIVSAPNFQTVEIEIKGAAPYVQHRFGHKALLEIREKQESGLTTKGKKRKARDFDEEVREAQHLSHENWNGIPATAFRNAMITACKIVGFHMTKGKLAIFIEPDGFDKLDASPLVKIIGEWRRYDTYGRTETGVAMPTSRPMWEKWGAKVRIRYDADMFSSTDVVNLLARAGLQVGIGEGRPDSSNSNGMGWGLWEIVT